MQQCAVYVLYFTAHLLYMFQVHLIGYLCVCIYIYIPKSYCASFHLNPANSQPTQYTQNIPIAVYTVLPDDKRISTRHT
jgi:hypothetical protein